MARTKIRERQVLDSDFESETEAQQRMDAHIAAFGHPPKPDPNNDDQKIIRYNASTDAIEWIPQADIQTIALPYYWDEARQKFLDNQMIRVMYYKNGSNKRNVWMNYAPAISSKKFPFSVHNNEEYCLVSYEYSTTDKNHGKVIKLYDVDNGNAELAYLDLGSSNIDYIYDDSANLDFSSGSSIGAKILGTTLSNPVLVLGLRKIYHPQ